MSTNKKKKISDLILMSDVDGTILSHGHPISQRNLDAISRFTKKGGHFGLATGRANFYTNKLVEELGVNFTCVLYNGAVLYDFKTGDFIWERLMIDKSKEYVADIMVKFPEICALLVTRENYFDVAPHQRFFLRSPSRRNDFVTESTIDAISAPCYKAIFFMDDEIAVKFSAYISQNPYPDVRFVFTNPTLAEMLPIGSSKAEALEKLMTIENFSADNLVTIGDYYNDIEMLELAGFSAAMPTAPQELKDIADIIVGPCIEGGLADLIEHLEKEYD